MNPLKISLRNCRTFHELDFDIPEGLTAIIGDNGAGKSTIINSIDVALFGALGRSLAEWVPWDGSDGWLVVELQFEHGPDTYRVRRSYNPKGRGTTKLDLDKAVPDYDEDDLRAGIALARQGIDPGLYYDRWEPLTEESTARTQEIIEGLVGFSRDTFRASAFLAQNEAGRFCEAQPRERKRILAEILGLGEWEGWLDRAREARRGVELGLSGIEAILAASEPELAMKPAVESAKARAAEELVAARTDAVLTSESLAAARSTHAGLLERQTARREAAEAVTRAQAALDDLNRRIGASEAELDALTARLATREVVSQSAARVPELDRQRIANHEADSKWEKRLALLAEIDEIAVDADRSTKKATELRDQAGRIIKAKDSDEAEHCDRCQQILGGDAAERAALSLRQEADGLIERARLSAKQIDSLQEQVRSLPTAPPDRQAAMRVLQELNEATAAREQLAALTEVEERVGSLDANLNEMRAEVRSREEAFWAASRTAESLGPHDPRELEEAAHKIAVLEHEEREHREAVETLSGTVARHTAQLERLDQVAAEAQEARLRREALQADLDLYTALEKACGVNGVPALILENVAIPQIEAEATRILGELGGPAYAVELHTLKQTKTAGVADTLDIILLTQNGDAPYEAFSGGEKARIAFALRLALAQLLANRRGAQTGLLVIDEIDGLDAAGVSALVRVLEDLQKRIPRIIVVSHDAELRDAFPQTIRLENRDGMSTIVENPVEITA